MQHATRSSGGGLGGLPHPATASADEGSKSVVKSGSFGNNQAAAGPLTAVVTVPSDSDSPSPASTSAGGNEPAANGSGRQQQPGGPVAEGIEAAAAAARLAGETAGRDSAAAAACSWEVEQAGNGSHAAATAVEDSAAVKGSAAAAAGGDTKGARSRRWVQSSGNIWLLQGLADALGITRESAVADAVAPGEAAEGRRPRLSSAAGGLWSDEGVCGAMCGGKWGTSHVPKMAPLTASQRLTNEAIMQVRLGHRVV